MSMRYSSGIINILVAATSYTLWTVGVGKKAKIKRIMWTNRTGGNGFLRIGYTDVVAAAFQQVLPDILMVNGVDGELNEGEFPIAGNDVDGFCADATAAAGSTGLIVCQGSVGGAIPTDVQVIIEVEEE